MQKFENMDLIAALEAIMHQNTAYYRAILPMTSRCCGRPPAATSRKISCCCGCPGPLEHSASGNGMCCSKIPKPTIHGNFAVNRPMTGFLPMYHTSDCRRTMARMLAALPDMDTEMLRLANGTIAKLEQMTDADFDGQRFDFTGE